MTGDLYACKSQMNFDITINRQQTEPLPIFCALDLIPSSLFLEMMTTLDVWMEVLVLVCRKLTPKLTL
jgi:hypothetical protein